MNVRPQTIRIATRSSDLALWQANHVADLLRAQWGAHIELCTVTTQGDRILDRPLHEIGGKGLFVKAVEEKLLDGSADLAVHSMKDLPAELAPGLTIAATPARECPNDALVGPSGAKLAELPAGFRLGTGSLRRAALVRRLAPQVEVMPLRGNVPTRVKKVDDGELDGVLLAAAGLRRLGLEVRISELLDLERFVPAPTQGVLALQCRADDSRMIEALAPLNDESTSLCAQAERAFLRRLGAGCTVPMGCYAALDQTLSVTGLVIGTSGRPYFSASRIGKPQDGEGLGTAVAQSLLDAGAAVVLDALN